jgi:hypothetical protein
MIEKKESKMFVIDILEQLVKPNADINLLEIGYKFYDVLNNCKKEVIKIQNNDWYDIKFIFIKTVEQC